MHLYRRLRGSVTGLLAVAAGGGLLLAGTAPQLLARPVAQASPAASRASGSVRAGFPSPVASQRLRTGTQRSPAPSLATLPAPPRAVTVAARRGHPKAAMTPRWATEANATVTPGVQVVTGPDQCTANFVYVDGTGAVYLGQAAHCSSTGGSTATDGCSTGSLPLGTPVTVSGASRPGTLVYNSWLAMHAAHEADANTCAYNDLALIRLDPADVGSTNPSVPVFGGPNGLDTAGLATGEKVYSYGNSGLRLGLTQTSPKYGASLFDDGGGWDHVVYTATPGIPGDSGSGFLDASGRALGVLSTVALAPYAASNGVGDLGREIAYARAHGVPGLTLALGTAAFRPLA